MSYASFPTWKQLAEDLGDLVARKNLQYGNSAEKTCAILASLYPGGIQPFQYRDMLLVTRVLDKLARLSVRGVDGRDLGNESPWEDIAGYGLIGLMMDIERDGEHK